jgi:phosphate transport system substrate-binding protein
MSAHLGKVKTWNDPLIAPATVGETPDTPINVVVRADNSGTAFVFTQHLIAIWVQQSPGTNNMPNWAVGTRSRATKA